MTTVGSYSMRSDAAELAQLLLWAAGIPYEIQTDDACDAYPSNDARRMRLLVEERDADDARWALTDPYRPTTRKKQS
jgi:hypothetical protein